MKIEFVEENFSTSSQSDCAMVAVNMMMSESDSVKMRQHVLDALQSFCADHASEKLGERSWRFRQIHFGFADYAVEELTDLLRQLGVTIVMRSMELPQ